MMKKIYSVIATLLVTASVLAQAPQKMSYQAVVRNSNNTLITSSLIGIKISILQGSPSTTGTVVYAETQTPTTNANGLVSLEIGIGTVISGSFATINWATGPYFIKTEIDPTGGASYTIAGASELMSVPYALFSANGTPGPQGVMGPVGPPGQGGITQQGPEILVTGTGTIANPYTISTRTYTLGLWPELGGYVFRITADGRHGLVSEIVDQAIGINWFAAQNAISNPSSHSFNGQGFTDWRLPTKYELNEMFIQKMAIGSFEVLDNYWSSTEFNEVGAWSQNFNSGGQVAGSKDFTWSLRAVRAF